ncbi:MAG: iron-sulfur cluster-binding domain-containing protein [Hahellaceae bacterium]|nr:iron-sulfur cluster-binding domain-containing protein [Hahellaceae bacterium]
MRLLNGPLQTVIDTLLPESVFDFWLEELGALHRKRRVMARVVERFPETPEMITLVLQPNGHFQGFQPGQHVDVTVEIEGRKLTRSYSPSRPVSDEGLIQISVKRVRGGAVSPFLCSQVQVGDLLELSQAYGDMQLPTPHDFQKRPLLFLAGGSGITPLSALFFELAKRAQRDTIPTTTLMVWAPTDTDFAFRDELETIARSIPDLRVAFITTRQALATPLDSGLEHSDPLNSGRATLEQIAHRMPNWEQASVYACGPAEFVGHLASLTKGKVQAFTAEAFTLPTLSADDGHASITLDKRGKTVTVSRGETLLDSLEHSGETLESGCRRGICLTCACQQVSGVSENIITGERQQDAGMTIRPCISRPLADVTLHI